MKKALKQICLLFVSLSLTMTLVNSGVIDNFLCLNNICSHIECSDIATQSEHSHTACYGDDVLLNDSKIKSNKFIGSIDLVFTLRVDFKNSYLTSIWQPPKIS